MRRWPHHFSHDKYMSGPAGIYIALCLLCLLMASRGQTGGEICPCSPTGEDAMRCPPLKCQTPEPAPVPAPEPIKPCLARGSTVYSGCGYIYGARSAVQRQCPSGGRTYSIIADGTLNDDPCTLARSSEIYLGCGYAYTDRAAALRQCRRIDGVARWIGDDLR